MGGMSQGGQTEFPGNYMNQSSQAGYSRFGSGSDFMSRDYVTHGSQALFTQVGFSETSQDDAQQNHFGMTNATTFQSQGGYSQPFPQYNMNMTPLNFHATPSCQQSQPLQGEDSQTQKRHYNV